MESSWGVYRRSWVSGFGDGEREEALGGGAISSPLSFGEVGCVAVVG